MGRSLEKNGNQNGPGRKRKKMKMKKKKGPKKFGSLSHRKKQKRNRRNNPRYKNPYQQRKKRRIVETTESSADNQKIIATSSSHSSSSFSVHRLRRSTRKNESPFLPGQRVQWKGKEKSHGTILEVKDKELFVKWDGEPESEVKIESVVLLEQSKSNGADDKVIHSQVTIYFLLFSFIFISFLSTIYIYQYSLYIYVYIYILYIYIFVTSSPCRR